MRVRRFIWLMSFFLGVLIAGCSGGSGSSGFDNFPSSENAAIQTALNEQHCVTFDGLHICPADTVATLPTASPTAMPGVTATPTANPINPTPARTQQPGITASPTPTSPRATATPTPTATASPHSQTPQAPHVDTGINDASVPCASAAVTNTCEFFVPFAPEGFPPGTVFRVAVRRVDPASTWAIGADPAATGSPNAPAFDAPVAVDAAPNAADKPVRIQLAILAWVTPPAAIPATVQTLGASDADYAFVTSDLELQPALTSP